MNTAPGVWSGMDKLPDTTALDAFLREHDITAGAHELAGADLDGVRELRASTRTVIDNPDPAQLVSGATSLTAGLGSPTLAIDETGLSSWAVTAGENTPVAQRLALVCAVGILGVVHTLGAGRFRPCVAPTCSGAFIDTSRPGRRRYCMPGICGNRVNVANHRARTRST
ncbi:CGNR zinc finger domain-containing protein [Amycolatopsis antarctica]|uniref:CGNR zinc finger domain-containing protein n=1 Tax=Amycolatopsis antarctica TaxID=1854586 RepID=UPI0023E82E3E|nr:CGNR zinc finger domain-containing protein [Amycolatopsis antarctica]